MKQSFTKEWNANSSVYHAIEGMLFHESGLICEVDRLFDDDQKRNLAIQNEDQLKKILFNRIRTMYNKRIQQNLLTYRQLAKNEQGNMEIKKFRFIKSDQNDDNKDSGEMSGFFRLYPRGVRCSKCADFIILNDEMMQKLNGIKCQHKTCKGVYRQIAQVKFCPKCGKLDEIYDFCEHAKQHIAEGKNPTIKLTWRNSEAVETWRFVCDVCKAPYDFLRFKCNHTDRSKQKICQPEVQIEKYQIMSIRSGGVVTPVIVSSIDIPTTTEIKHPELDQLMCAIIAGKLNFLNDANKENVPILEFIDKRYQSFRNKDLARVHMETIKEYEPHLSEDQLYQKYAGKLAIDKIESAIAEIREKFPIEELNMEEITNFHSLKGTFTGESAAILLSKTHPQQTANFNKHKIKEISYLPKLKIISSCIGTITGPTRSSKDDFAPHFTPLWTNPRANDGKFHAHSYPYETEGILVEFDKEAIVRWLEQNTGQKYSGDPHEILLTLKEGSTEYAHVYKLLHTIAHLVLHRSSIYTGIDTDSCSEMIFATSGAVLIYATSPINIGGFGSVFDTNIMDLFDTADITVRRCVYDPLCLSKDGACFSCMYLPEFVCCRFNNLLDRDVLLGTGKHYKVRYWNDN